MWTWFADGARFAGALYLVAINLLGYAAMGVDKRRARRGAWRIPEKKLFLIAGLFGSAGVWLGMKRFHHKTLHRSFALGIPAICAAQAALLFALAALIR